MLSSLKYSLKATVCGGAILAGCSRSASFSHCAKDTKVPTSKPRRGELTTMNNKVVLITGATAGIGAACAWRFAEEGSKLVLVGRRADRLQLLKSEIQSAFPQVKVHTVAMSVTDYKAVEALPKNLPADFNEVDVLVNNAGLARGVTSVENNNVADAIEVIETNILGTIAFTTAFTPGMIARGRGHIVNMGSIAVSSVLFSFSFFS
jgi:3-hydroxy acid dehydrogenase/malonic semialdehyde reductase